MKDKRQKIKNSKRGMVLVIAVTIIVILAVIGIGLIQLGRNARLQGVKDVLQISSRSAADAGIEDAVRHMIKDEWDKTTNKPAWIASWNDPTGTQVGLTYPTSGYESMGNTFGNSKFQCNIYKGTKSTGYGIVSTGTAAGVTRTVHAAVILKSLSYPIDANGFIIAYPGVDMRTIPCTSNDPPFKIQTNSILPNAITIKPKITVPGDVVVGPGGDPDIGIDLAKNSTITGNTGAADDYMDFPPVYPPTDLTVGTPTKVGSNYYIYGNMQINGGYSTSNTLYIGDPCATNKGPIKVYVAGATNLNSHSSLIVNAGYSLELYLGGDMYTASNSVIRYGTTTPTTNAQIIDAAKRITIKGTTNCTSILLQPNGSFYGTIYAPDASLTMQPGGNFYGAILGAENITLKPTGDFIFIPCVIDPCDVEILSMGVKHGSWWE